MRILPENWRERFSHNRAYLLEHHGEPALVSRRGFDLVRVDFTEDEIGHVAEQVAQARRD